VEDGDLADEGGGEGVGGLLTAKDDNSDLDARACNSMADQREEEAPTMDIYEPPGRKLDAWDGRDVAGSDVLNVVGDLLADDKFGLSAASMLSVFAKFYWSTMTTAAVTTLTTWVLTDRSFRQPNSRIRTSWFSKGKRCHGPKSGPM
jgi:hypothetical protein